MLGLPSFRCCPCRLPALYLLRKCPALASPLGPICQASSPDPNGPRVGGLSHESLSLAGHPSGAVSLPRTQPDVVQRLQRTLPGKRDVTVRVRGDSCCYQLPHLSGSPQQAFSVHTTQPSWVYGPSAPCSHEGVFPLARGPPLSSLNAAAGTGHCDSLRPHGTHGQSASTCY